MDVDHSGTLDFDEFFDLMSTMMGGWEPDEELGAVWRVLDPRGTGRISRRHLGHLLSTFGARIPDDELGEIFAEVGHLDRLSREQFMDAVLRPLPEDDDQSGEDD